MPRQREVGEKGTEQGHLASNMRNEVSRLVDLEVLPKEAAKAHAGVVDGRAAIDGESGMPVTTRAYIVQRRDVAESRAADILRCTGEVEHIKSYISAGEVGQNG